MELGYTKAMELAIKQEVEARAPCITLDNTLNSHAHHDLFDDRFTSWN